MKRRCATKLASKLLSVFVTVFVATLASSSWAAGAPDTFDVSHDATYKARHSEPADALYKSPVQLLMSRDGGRLFVVCEGTNEILVVDIRSREVVQAIPVGGLPFGLAEGPESRLYVSHRDDGTVSIVDLDVGQVVQTAPVGDDPHGLMLDKAGEHLFVANLGTDDVAVLDASNLTEVRRLFAGVGPFDLALAPNGRTLCISNQYSNPTEFRTPSTPELTVIDAEGLLVDERRSLPGTAIPQGIAITPDGAFAVTVVEIPKNLIPQSQVYQGWMVTYGFALTELRPWGRTAFLLIDEPNQYFADPYDIVLTPDGRSAFISSSGANLVTVVDMDAVYRVLGVEDGRIGSDDATLKTYARHLGLSSEYVTARIPTGINPKGLAVSLDGQRVYAANRLDDSVTIIDVASSSVGGTIDLGGPEPITKIRKGQRLFGFASISFHRQMSCNTCHPEESVDGLVYDIAADGGFGRNLVDNLTLRGIARTAPFKWSGKNPNLARQEGPRAAQLFFRTHGFSADENEAIVAYLESIPARPNRYRQPGNRLDEFQQLGKRMFDRGYDNLGRYIPVANRCVTCHPAPFGTDRRRHDIGSKSGHDRDGVFDTPHLQNVYERAPYMHDGRCYSLEEIWTMHNPYDTHGVTNDMTKDQLNALIEYIKTF